ncbi:MAG: hypothetical protein K2X26_10685 [Chitinophagaceae bacterium]|nr:hypothetical protein [Chitinophagaceae bacterium]
MKNYLLLLIFFLLGYTLMAQSGMALVAEKNNTKRVFETNERIKIRFSIKDEKYIAAGRIQFVSADTLYLKGLHRRTEYRIRAIALKDLEKVKKFYIGARSTTGVVAMLGSITGIAILADGLSDQPVFFGNVPISVGIGAIIGGVLPHIIVTMSEPSYKTKRGFRFYATPIK